MVKGGGGDKEMFVYKELMCSVQFSFTTAVCSHGLCWTICLKSNV